MFLIIQMESMIGTGVFLVVMKRPTTLKTGKLYLMVVVQ